MTTPPPRRPSPAFSPRFTIGLLYLIGFFFLYSLLLVLPQLLDVLARVPPGPDQQEIAREVARQAIRPRLAIVLALAVLSTGLGGYYQILPGMRE